MVIRQLEVERYKPYPEKTTISCRPLTILIGKNNSGKSAIARAFPLIAGSLVSASHRRDIVTLSSYGLTHGRELVDIITNRAVHGVVTLGLRFDEVAVSASIQNVVRSGSGRPRAGHSMDTRGSGRVVHGARVSGYRGSHGVPGKDGGRTPGCRGE